MSADHNPEYKGAVHEYDGILEHDNRLPIWWLFTLFGAVAFAVAYWFSFHTFGWMPGLRATYADEWKKHEAEVAAREAANPADDASLQHRSEDAAAVAAGMATFKSTCSACHAQNGEGLVGPNLTDAAWIHGNKPTDLYKTISDGVLAKGMPPWKPTLGDKGVRDVVAYLITIQGRNLPGKAPEGFVDGVPVGGAAAPAPVDAGAPAGGGDAGTPAP